MDELVSCVLALCVVRCECISLLDSCTWNALLSDDTPTALQEPASLLVKATGATLQTLLHTLTEHDVKQHLQNDVESNADMEVAHASLMNHPALALRLHQLGWPMELFLKEMSELLFLEMHQFPICDPPPLDLLAFVPAGLDLTDSPQEEPYLSPLTVARAVASSVGAAELMPVSVTELMHQRTAHWNQLPINEPRTDNKNQHLPLLCVQLVHEWRLHSDKLRTLLLTQLSSPSNGARDELHIIGDYLDLEPPQRQEEL